nr:tegument protein UL51 [Equid gammaherpesvirus 5]UTK45591.1 tegument protein UL51 [Equid gammaherpesvirus 5]UTK45669.1 tegument protein UL51 [Equid gammaherpesvirus 5]UTK45748.1 tegument protein UL51 [Equid gammaherpesvirus 5]
MSSRWLQWTCCGLWPFGKSSKQYHQIINVYEDDAERMRAEIDMGLPPGVSVGDLIQNKQSEEALRQAHLLALQSNDITDYLRRFDAVRVPESCQSIVQAQIAKLKSVQQIIWNTMISMAVGNVTIDDSTLKTLLNKQAGESMALLEMEKLATALKMDTSTDWAQNIAAVVTAPVTAAPRPVCERMEEQEQLMEPLYDDPEGMEMVELTPATPSPFPCRERVAVLES